MANRNKSVNREAYSSTVLHPKEKLCAPVNICQLCHIINFAPLFNMSVNWPHRYCDKFTIKITVADRGLPQVLFSKCWEKSISYNIDVSRVGMVAI